MREALQKADDAVCGRGGDGCDMQGEELLAACDAGAMFQKGSSFRNYWDDCVRASKLPENSSGMRYHATTIRMALNLFTTSRKAYRQMAGGEPRRTIALTTCMNRIYLCVIVTLKLSVARHAQCSSCHRSASCTRTGD
jgi:hypothetical protein